MSGFYYTNAQQRQLRRIIPDLIRSRQLLLDLVWKDIRVRYRYALLGFLWAVIEPLFMMLILTIVFSYFFRAKVESLQIESGPQYAIFILSGLIFWQFFSTSVASSTRSIVDNRTLVTKVNFPREVLPLSYVGVALVNWLIGLILLIILFFVVIGSLPLLGLIAMLPVFAIEVVLAVGLGLAFSGLNAIFRDVSYMVDAALLFGFYASPVFYPPEYVESAAPDLYPLYFVNPMAGLLMSYRNALFQNTFPDPGLLLWPAACAIVVFLVGCVVFRRNAPTVSDRL